jgi:hypothetical protein
LGGIAVPRLSETKRARASRYLQSKRPARITETEWHELGALLAPVSESYLRSLLRSSGFPLDPLVEGVRQDSFAELERTLAAISLEYSRALDSGDTALAARCRQCVITGKEHAHLAARRRGVAPEVRVRKEEMASWMLLWLEHPSLFPDWLSTRKKIQQSGESAAP